MSRCVIHLENIEPKKIGKYENCYVELEQSKKEELFTKSVSLSPDKSLTSLAKVLDVKLYELSDGKNRMPIPLSVLRKMSDFLISNNFLNFSLRNLEKHVEYIKGTGKATKIVKPKLPFNFKTLAGVRIISKLFHDGGIGKYRQPHYHNQNMELINEFINDIKEVFGTLEIPIQRGSRQFYVELPRLLGDILELCGCFIGSKVEYDVSPPNWIINLHHNLIGEFLRVAMDDEGSVRNRSISIGLSHDITNLLDSDVKSKLLKMNKIHRNKVLLKIIENNKRIEQGFVSKILLFDQQLFSILGIRTSTPHLQSCYNDLTNEKLRAVFVFSISGKENIRMFYDKVGFKLKYKKTAIESYLLNTKGRALNGKSVENLIKMASLIQKRRGCFTDFDMANKFNYHHQYLGRIRNIAEKRGIIKRVGRVGHKLQFRLVYGYQGPTNLQR